MPSVKAKDLVEAYGTTVSGDPDLELDQESQYLLERVQTLRDFWEFLKKEEEIQFWSPEDIFGFVLTLIDPEPGFDSQETLSDEYKKAQSYVESLGNKHENLSWKSHIDYGA